MRLIKTLFLLLIAACLIILGIGNMAPVDLFVLPERMAGEAFALRGVPLAAVIIASVLLGLILGQVLEFFREGKLRRRSNDRARELVRLKDENDKLKAQIADPDEDLPKIPKR